MRLELLKNRGKEKKQTCRRLAVKGREEDRGEGEEEPENSCPLPLLVGSCPKQNTRLHAAHRPGSAGKKQVEQRCFEGPSSVSLGGARQRLDSETSELPRWVPLALLKLPCCCKGTSQSEPGVGAGCL